MWNSLPHNAVVFDMPNIEKNVWKGLSIFRGNISGNGNRTKLIIKFDANSEARPESASFFCS
jgi:hypothetical protein